ncbi:hypothetical protein CK489_34070 [Bradyrhizobium sp. UFLA03-84]|nr:hypothetical protein CK489_34070 [Bradyrhizobium sp. UFLA03-84]
MARGMLRGGTGVPSTLWNHALPVRVIDLVTGVRKMGSSHLNDPRHWRERAEETRTKAEHFWDEESKQRMFRIAVEYDRLADQAAERARAEQTAALARR